MVAVNEGEPRDNAERDAEIWKKRHVQRWTMVRLAAEYGISQQRVSQICAEFQKALPPVDVEAIRREVIETHLDVMMRAYVVAEMRGAPVTAGKDGDIVRDPEDNAVVRDQAAQLAALALINKTGAELRKFLGLDAASKIETSATVRYEVVGVDTEALK